MQSIELLFKKHNDAILKNTSNFSFEENTVSILFINILNPINRKNAILFAMIFLSKNFFLKIPAHGIAFLICVTLSMGWTSLAPSGEQKTKNTTEKRIDSLRREHKKFVYNDPAKALELINEALSMADSANHSSAKIECRIDLSYLHRITGNYELALQHAFDALTKLKIQLAEDKGNDDGNMTSSILLAETHTAIGKTYGDMTYYPLALKYFKKAETIFIEHEKLRSLAYLYMNKAIIYDSNGESMYSNTLFKKSLQIFKQLKDTASIGHAYNNLSISYKQSEDFGTAKKYNDSAIHIYRMVENKAALANALNNSARIAYDQKKFAAGLDYLDVALRVIDEIGNLRFNSDNNALRGATHFKLGHSDIAEKILLEELPNSKTHFFMENSELILETLVALYQQKQDLRELSTYSGMLLDLRTDKEEKQDKKAIIEEKYAKEFDEQADLFDSKEKRYKKSNEILILIFVLLALQFVVLIILFQKNKLLV